MVLKRGVDFRFTNTAIGNIKDFAGLILEYSLPNGTNDALMGNIGSPVNTPDWYQGTWKTFTGGDPAMRVTMVLSRSTLTELRLGSGRR